MELDARDITIQIGIGNNKALALDRRNNLLIHDTRTGVNVSLGPMTQQRAREISDYLQRLAIHTPEK